MDLAVIKTSGSQYLVSPGESITLPKLGVPEGEELIFKDVLLLKTGQDVVVGTPLVEGVVVKGVVSKNFSGRKLDILKFKAKSRYRRRLGFRPRHCLVKIIAIEQKKNK